VFQAQASRLELLTITTGLAPMVGLPTLHSGPDLGLVETI
jgi:hypothetical protein